MYGTTGYGIQPYGSTYPQITPASVDITINASESVIRGAGRLTMFSLIKTTSLVRAFVKREFIRFRPKISD